MTVDVKLCLIPPWFLFDSLVADAVANIPGMDAVEEAVANIPLDFPSQQSHKQSCYFAVLRDKFR